MSENGNKNVILKVEDLISSYGVIKALKGVSLEVREGELVSLLGANGAGKSTLLKSIIGMVKINSGHIWYGGEEITGQNSSKIINNGISIVPEGRKIFADMSVEDNLELGSFSREKDKALDQEILEQVFAFFPRLKERRKQMGGLLSGGEQQMLAIGRAMMSRPRLLLMDEPSMGLAPLVVEEVFSVIRRLKDMGVTILLVEQNANMALQVCDRAYVLSTGNIVDEGPGEEMMKKSSLVEAYLGEAADKEDN